MDGSGGAGMIEKFIEWIVLGVMGVGAWLYKNLHSRIAELERTTVRQDTFSKFEERADAARTELRESIIKLYDRIDELKSLLLERGHDRDR